jgi:hypothetical protein
MVRFTPQDAQAELLLGASSPLLYKKSESAELSLYLLGMPLQGYKFGCTVMFLTLI